jgi:hypothetical protein
MLKNLLFVALASFAFVATAQTTRTAYGVRNNFSGATISDNIQTEITSTFVQRTQSNGELSCVATNLPAYSKPNPIYGFTLAQPVDMRSAFNMVIRCKASSPGTFSMRITDANGVESGDDWQCAVFNMGPDFANRTLTWSSNLPANFNKGAVKEFRFCNWGAGAYTGTMTIDSIAIGNQNPVVGIQLTGTTWNNDFTINQYSDLAQTTGADGGVTISQQNGAFRAVATNPFGWYKRFYQSTLVDTSDAVDIRGSMKIAVKIRSTAAVVIQGRLSSAINVENKDIFVSVAGDNTWRSYTFNYTGAPNNQTTPVNYAKIMRVAFWNITNNYIGTVEFDSLRVGDINALPPSQAVNPDNANIKYLGRYRNISPIVKEFNFGGCSQTIRFTGSFIRYRHGMNTFQTTTNYPSFYAIVDENTANPVVFTTDPNTTEYTIADNLSGGEHTVTVYRLSGVFGRASRFLGFSIPLNGTVLPVTSNLTRRIEFYGDSQTEGSYMDGQPTALGGVNHYLAYANQVAIAQNAEMTSIAMGGVGLVKGYQIPNFKMDRLIGATVPYAAGDRWDWAAPQPHVVVMNVGQNDKFTQDGSPLFLPGNIINAYMATHDSLRIRYPNANIIYTLGGMDAVAPGQPWGDFVKRAVDSIRLRRNDVKTHAYLLPYIGVGGAHPTVAGHKVMADSLSAFINRAEASGAQLWVENGLPQISSLVPGILNFGYVPEGSMSAPKKFKVVTSGLSGNVIVAAPNGYLVSADSLGNYGSSLIIDLSGGTVWIKFAPTAVQVYSAQLNLSSAALSTNVAIWGTSDLTANLALSSSQVLVYPNPAQQEVFVEGKFEGKAQFKVLDIQGREMMKGNLERELTSIDLKNLSSGLYYLTLFNGREMIQRKINKL